MTAKIGWILLLALGLRVGAVLAVQTYLDRVAHREFLLPGDAEGYWELGQKLAHGEPYDLYSPPRQVMRMPGLPLLLAASIRVCGESLFVARLLMAIIGALACGLVYWLAVLLFDARVAIIAATLAAVSPLLVGFSVEVLSETPFGAALVGSLILLAKVARQKQPASLMLAFVAGLGIALATYIRPTWLLAAPLFGVWHVGRVWWLSRDVQGLRRPEAVNFSWDRLPACRVFRRIRQAGSLSHANLRRPIIEAVVVIAGCAAAMAPWTIRNWAATGHFVTTTLWVGPSLYDGLHPQATGDSNMQFFEDDRLMHAMSEFEMDREYRRRAWAYARAEPLRALQLSGIKLGRYWSPWPNAKQFRDWRMCLVIGAFCVPMLGFAIVGAWTSRREVTVLLLTLGPAVYFAAIHALFVGSIRYRLPAEYPLLVLTAAGIVAVWDQRKRRIEVTHVEHVVEDL